MSRNDYRLAARSPVLDSDANSRTIGGGRGAEKPKKAAKSKKAPPHKLTENQIKARIIEESKANYHGNCPCDEDTDAAGRRRG